MLDDLKLINTRDKEDALGIAQKQWQQYKHNFNFSYEPPQEINKIVFSGMGGSGLAAKVFLNWPKVKVPFDVVQDYDLPSYIDQNTLLIISSYSGNTEEEISVINHALELKSDLNDRLMLIVITSGGKLQEIAEQNNLPIILLPSGYQPRYTIGFQLRALCEITDAINLTESTTNELEATAEWLKDKLDQWEPTIPTKNNRAKQLAQEAVGKSVVIYSSNKFSSVAYKWKINFNENANSIAWWNQYSEFNHNEFIGWTNLSIEKLYTVFDLRSTLDNDQIKKRFEISAQLLSGKRPSPEVVELEGDTLLKQILWGIGLGDFVSLYTAILSGIDPTPVALIEEFKHRLA